MRPFAICVAAMLAGCAAPPPPSGPPKELRELAGRVAGPPQRCVLIERQEALRVSDEDGGTLLYGRGGTIWVNRVGPACRFSHDDILISEPIGAYYCRGDRIRSFDRFTKIPGSACILGDFVAYRR